MDSSPIPTPKTTDHEDVSWALSTAEANWKRGDQSDALKWLQRAAEAASEAGLDTRYLELAKAASELAARIESSPRLAPLPPLTPIPQTDNVPHSGPSGRPSGATIIQPMGIVLPDAPRKSTTPPPVPNRTSAPPARPSSVPAAGALGRSSSPPRTSTGPVRTPSKPSPPRVPPPAPSRPAAVTARREEKKDASQPQVPTALDSGPEIAIPIQTGERRVEHLQTVRNLDKMAHLAALTRPSDPGGSPRLAPRPPDPEDQTQIMPASVAPQTEVQPAVGHGGPPSRSEGAESRRPDAWPTQNSVRGEDATYVGAVPNPDSMSDPTLVPDPAIPRPTQALRVVVYRTPEGVRIAPAGQKVSAMSIEAMLVALDPSADLAAWLK